VPQISRTIFRKGNL